MMTALHLDSHSAILDSGSSMIYVPAHDFDTVTKALIKNPEFCSINEGFEGVICPCNLNLIDGDFAPLHVRFSENHIIKMQPHSYL